MKNELDYSETQIYLQHFRDKGCQSEIVNNTEALFNLCWFTVDKLDQLKLELEKKKVNIARLKEMIFGVNTSSPSSSDNPENEDSNKEGNENDAQANSKLCSAEDKNNSDKENGNQKAKGHGRRGVDDYPGAKTVVCSSGPGRY